MQYSRHLVDRRRVHVVGGRGGGGACVYTRHKRHQMLGPGWPSGGSGGKGGDVVVRATSRRLSLAHLDGAVLADNGEPGRRKRLNGASGRDAVVEVPRGVLVRELLPESERASERAERAERTERRFFPGEVLRHLDDPGEAAVVAAGGRGGGGNTMARPHECTPGAAGEERWIELELKMVADVGLIGKPNAGKSTLLGALSRACPKIAPYPFTTVAPYVGRAEFVDGSSLTVADVPGLVEGAHLGEGLGHEFLRHLERTQVLLYVLDASRTQDPFADFLGLQREVALYSREMAARPCGVVANKCDLAPDVTLARADGLFRAIAACEAALGDNLPLFVRATSARFGEGIKGLLREVRSILRGAHPEWLARAATPAGAAAGWAAGAQAAAASQEGAVV